MELGPSASFKPISAVSGMYAWIGDCHGPYQKATRIRPPGPEFSVSFLLAWMPGTVSMRLD